MLTQPDSQEMRSAMAPREIEHSEYWFHSLLILWDECLVSGLILSS